MNHLRQLWNWHGVIGRLPYLGWGVGLFALKWNLDRLIVGWSFGGRLEFADYFRGNFPSPDLLGRDEAQAHGWRLLLPSLPFLWCGVVLTLQRLRDARLPLPLAVLFVVPVLKWLLFLLALCSPSAGGITTVPAGQSPALPPRDAGLPGRLGSAVIGLVGAGLFTVLAGWLGTEQLNLYGWGLFVGIPFVAGFLAGFVHCLPERRSPGECMVVGVLSMVVAGAGFLAFALEGLICIVMAAPPAVLLAALGGLLAGHVQPGIDPKRAGRTCCVAILAVPLMLGIEHGQGRIGPLIEVRSAIEIEGTPGQVWPRVIAFTELPPPTEWLFRLGIAYPLRAEMVGSGTGAVRHCVFSTGAFVEPIEVWDAPNLLRFGVTSNPPPMEEWTPYQAVHPPHLEGFLVSERGQFRLHALPGGRTRLEGTTWYRHNLWPARYWQIWSDHIIHRIHLRVLRHIKAETEAASRQN